ncbi:MAG: hypothetical protein HY537_10950 [Deltaproteobacteria bacterium]|nr:hypothetical protein [Deltaproteobacteria bacterium]
MGKRKTRLGIILILLGFAFFAQAKTSWNFTPSDYSDLMKQNKKLTFHEDSYWFPEVYARTLLEVLHWSLTTKPEVTWGINVNDFYHGHVLCKKPLDSDIEKNERNIFSRLYERSRKTLYDAVDGKSEEEYQTHFAHYLSIMNEIEMRAGDFLTKLHSTGKCIDERLLFHSFERVGPAGMKPGDSLRNFMAFPNATTPIPYTPPDIENADSYQQEYVNVVQFFFLVDETGQLHVTVGFPQDLSKIVGFPVRY